MRFVLILMFLVGWAVTGWHAVNVGTDHKMLLGAPQIEKTIDSNVRSAVLRYANHPIKIVTDGRMVRLSGPVNSEAERQDILTAVGQTRLLVDLDDNLVVLPTADPYRLTVEKARDGSIVLTGNVPDAATREALLARARGISDGAVVSDRLVIATGVPPGDWPGMARAGVTVLTNMSDGQVAFEGTRAVVSGAVPGVEAGQRLKAAIDAAPMGDWMMQVDGTLPVTDAYAFSAIKQEDGAVTVSGNAPNAAVREKLMSAAQAISEKPLDGELTLAKGMPGPDWPKTMEAGIAALAATTEGRLLAKGESMILNAEVEDDAALASLMPLIGDDWWTDITVRNPTPDARLEISVSADGSLVAAGLLPEGMEAGQILAALPGVTLEGLDAVARGRAADWAAPLDGLAIILPRFSDAQGTLTGRTLTIRGRLKRGFSADGARAALRAALDRNWELELEMQESAPLAELILSKRDNQIALSGVLPAGLDPDAALLLIGKNAGGEGLSGGGDGDAAAWTEALAAARDALARFRDSTGRIAENQVELDGSLLPGYPETALQQWTLKRMPEGWSVSIRAEELPPGEGDHRVSLVTGEDENFRQGFWLPNVDFEVSPEQCGQAVSAALPAQDAMFVTSSARIGADGVPHVNRLAAIAVRCLNSSVMTLEIAVHMDSVGNDQGNLTLSQERADALKAALLARGVRTEAVTSVGYGESAPIATNNTADGRARNRRIVFDWSKGGG